nr:histone-like nucleoid-structuring protein Lsr2 [Saccharomonospora sp.]
MFFALDGVGYTIDLTAEHADDLRSILTRYIEHARRTGGRKRARRLIDDPTPLPSSTARFAPRPTTRRKNSRKNSSTGSATSSATASTAKTTASAAKTTGATAKTGRSRGNRRTKATTAAESSSAVPSPKPAKRAPAARTTVPQVTFSAPES